MKSEYVTFVKIITLHNEFPARLYVQFIRNVNIRECGMVIDAFSKQYRAKKILKGAIELSKFKYDGCH